MQNQITISDNLILSNISGSANKNFKILENKFDIIISNKGNHINISGENSEKITNFIKFVETYIKNNPHHLDINILELFNLFESGSDLSLKPCLIKTKNKNIYTKTISQIKFCHSVDNHIITFASGSAGTGKTYLAVAKATEAYLKGSVNRIILTRPAIEAGEELGFLPGDMYEKIAPYLQPLYSSLYDFLPKSLIEKLIEEKIIEVLPIAFMRGRTFNNSFIIVDEAQNTTFLQLKLILTRIGQGSKMIIGGDLTQSDLPSKASGGMEKMIKLLKDVKQINSIYFSPNDSVRSDIVKDIIKAIGNE